MNLLKNLIINLIRIPVQFSAIFGTASVLTFIILVPFSLVEGVKGLSLCLICIIISALGTIGALILDEWLEKKLTPSNKTISAFS